MLFSYLCPLLDRPVNLGSPVQPVLRFLRSRITRGKKKRKKERWTFRLHGFWTERKERRSPRSHVLTFRRLANPFEVTFTRSFGDEINGLRKERRDSSSSSVKTHGPQLPPPFNYRLHELNTSVGNTRPRRGTKKKKKKKSVGESLNVVFG